MKNRRAIFWMLLAIALASFAHLMLSYRGGVDAALVPRAALVEEGSSGSILRLTAARADAPAAVLVRTGRWRQVEPFLATVDEKVVLKVIDALLLAGIEDFIGGAEMARLGRTYADFGLDAPRLELTVEGDAFASHLAFGAATPTGTGVYVSVAGEDAVYVVASNVFAAVDLPVDGFRRRSVLPVEVEMVQSFDVKRGSGAFMRFVREGELWKMVQPQAASASAAQVKKLLEALTAAEARAFAWPTGAEGEPSSATPALLAGYGLDPETAVTITVKCADARDYQVSFGKAAEDGQVYALVQNAGAVVAVDAALKDLALAETASFTDMRLFPVEAAAVSRVSVADGGETYLLAKGEDGVWHLDAPVAAATDTATVEALLERLLALTDDDRAATGVTVALATNLASVTVSRAAALGALRLEDLRSREILRLDPAQLKRIVVTRRGDEKPTAVVYDAGRRAWNVESSPVPGKVSAAAVDGIISLLCPLTAERIVQLKASAADLVDYGLETPQLTIAVDRAGEDTVRRNILIGERAPSGGLYATVGAADVVFVLPKETAWQLYAPLVRRQGGFDDLERK